MSRLRNALVVTAVCAFVLTTFTHLRASTDSGVPLGGVASLTSSGGWAAANLPLSKSLDRVLRRAVNRPPAKFVPSSVALSATADAWVATDDWNYVPGETVQISAGGFAAGVCG